MGRQMVDSLQEYVCFAGSLSVGLFVMIRTKHRRQESIMVRVWAGQPWDLLLLFLCYCEVSAVCYPPISSQVVLRYTISYLADCYSLRLRRPSALMSIL